MDNPERGTADQAVGGDPDAGEWLSIPEAIGWILFHDLEEARKCSGESPARMSLTYGFAKAGVEGPTTVMSPKDAEGALLAALKQGLVKAEAQQDGGARSMIPSRVWALVKSFSLSSPWVAENDGGATLLRDILVSADMLVKAFPEASTPSGVEQAGDAAIPSAVAASDAASAMAPSVGGSPKPADLQEAVAHLLTQKPNDTSARAVVLKAIADLGWTAWPNKKGIAIFKDVMSVAPGGDQEKPSRTTFDRVVNELNSLLKPDGSAAGAS